MATHSSVLAWRIPGTAEPGGLPSLGSHRVGHDWSDLAAAAAAAAAWKRRIANNLRTYSFLFLTVKTGTKVIIRDIARHGRAHREAVVFMSKKPGGSTHPEGKGMGLLFSEEGCSEEMAEITIWDSPLGLYYYCYFYIIVSHSKIYLFFLRCIFGWSAVDLQCFRWFSHTHTHGLFSDYLHYRLVQDIDSSSLCYRVSLCCLLHIYFF